MENLKRQHHAAATGGASPRLLRSRSGSTTARFAPIEETAILKRKPSKGDEIPSEPEETAAGGGEGGFARLMQRSNSKTSEAPKKSRSTSTPPSAWALSPGRSLSGSSVAAAAAVPKSPVRVEQSVKQMTGSKGGGVSGVLKFLRQKKISPVLEEGYHQLSVMYSRLHQWRFVNARAEASMAAVMKNAQKRLMNASVRIWGDRNLVMERRIEKQKVKNEMKVEGILNWEMGLLKEWRRIESRNAESIGRVSRKLSAISVCLPLLHNSKAEVMSVDDTISNAVVVMNEIETTVSQMDLQTEKMCLMLMELMVVMEQQKRVYAELERRMKAVMTSLEVQERSLMAHHIQLAR